MQTPSVLALSLIALLFASFAASNSALESEFIQCLVKNSHSSYPILESIYTPSNASFSSILQAYAKNLRFMTPNTPKPMAIVVVKHESHAQATITCAKTHGLQVRIRSGGHDFEGLSYRSDVPFVIIDMFDYRSIDIDIHNETAWVQAGATTGELYYRIAEKSKVHGFPSGVCTTLGTGGHFSGGGYGNMIRKYGLSVDNIIDANLVDVNGNILNRRSMGEDVFWALKGGGGASFGVILSWKIKLVQVPANVTVFRVEKTLEQSNLTDIVYQWQLVATKLPKDLFIRLMPQVVNGTGGTKTVQVSFIGQFLGQSESLIELVNESFPLLGLQRQDCIEMNWVDSALFWAEFPIGTSREVLLNRSTSLPSYFKGKSDYVKQPISKTGLDNIWNMMLKYDKILMQWNPYGGKMEEISEFETPFPHRKGNLFKVWYYVYWTEDGVEASNNNIDLIRSFYQDMSPYVSKAPREAFQNYRDLDIGSNPSNYTNFANAMVYGSKYFKDNFNRLVRAKEIVDPHNFFKHEQSIPPHSF